MSKPLYSLDPLRVWWDDSEHSVGKNLAVDEALLDVATVPILRFYQWHEAAVTMGYFQRWADMPFAGSDFDNSQVNVARRWTGGGMVDHRDDLPYSLIVPAGHPLLQVSATESYQWIHESLATALREVTGLDVAASNSVPDSPGPAFACFEAPVAWDVVESSSGRKISGAAQRRSRNRLLHQGSVLIGEHPDVKHTEEWRRVFADVLSHGKAQSWSPGPDLDAATTDLATSRYETTAWLERF